MHRAPVNNCKMSLRGCSDMIYQNDEAISNNSIGTRYVVPESIVAADLSYAVLN